MKNLPSRLIHACYWIWLLVSAIGLSAQNARPFVTLVEESTTGKHVDTIPASGPAIVDINSIIHLKIDIPALENEMFRFQGIAGSDERLKQLNGLNELLRNQNGILQLINDKFSGSSQPVLEDYKKLAEQSDYLLDGLERNLSDALYNELTSDEMELKFSKFGGPYIVFVINWLEGKADVLRDSLVKGLNGDSTLMVYFRLGAFLKNKSGGRPVHVEHFDEISPEAYSEVARFSPPLSEGEKSALSQTVQLNQTIGENTSTASGFFKQVVKARINDLFPSDSSKVILKATYNASLTKLNQQPDTKPAAQVLLENELNLNRVDQFYSLASQTYQQFADNFPQGIFGQNNFDQIFNQFEQLILNSYKTFNGDVVSFQQTAVTPPDDTSPPGLPTLEKVDNLYDNYVQGAQKDISGIKAIFSQISSLLNPFRKSYLANEDLSDKVSRFTAGKIPPEDLLELKYIGERKAGDEILVKAVLERGQDRKNRNFEQKELYRRYITIARVALHVKMSGSLILANPYNRDNPEVKLTNRYQFAPNYGIFLKWGSRKSKFYNDFLSFGVGMGFSSPDFNLDGTPEFGAGLMVTAIRDFFSAGWGWDFGVDAPYFFMGFNIPFVVSGVQTAGVTEPGF